MYIYPNAALFSHKTMDIFFNLLRKSCYSNEKTKETSLYKKKTKILRK